jgi:hypothetical protein
VPESFEVELETLTVGAAGEPAGELDRIARRQLAVANIHGQLEDRLGPHAAVEVVVQERFRRLADRFDFEQCPLGDPTAETGPDPRHVRYT